jgi:hypothetical protein
MQIHFIVELLAKQVFLQGGHFLEYIWSDILTRRLG